MKNNEEIIQTRTTQIFEAVANECDRACSAIITNNNFLKFIHTDSKKLTKKEIFDLINTTRNLLTSNQLVSAYIKDIIVISQKNNITVTTNNFQFDINSLEKYDEFINSDRNILTTTIKTKSENGNLTTEHFLLCRKITGTYDNSLVFFVIDTDAVIDAIYSFLPENSIFYLYNQDDILIHSKTEINEITTEKLNILFEGKEKISKYNIFSKDFSPYSFKMILFSDNTNYVKLTIAVVLVFLLITIISILLIYRLSYIFTKKTMEPISNIIEIIKNPNHKNYTAKTLETPEIQFITKNILESIDNNTFYKEQFEKKLDELNEAHEIALRAQINPHFLFNTLETIQAVGFNNTGNNNIAPKMITMLSRLLKISFKNDKKFITVKEEIQHIKTYLEIQQIRYYDLFEVKWDIDDKCLNFSTLKLILQPIVENAIYHGIKNADHFCYLKISINESSDKESIIFEVENNGIKIEQKMLENLKKMLNGEIAAIQSHIGLNNVNRRIKLAFGEIYGCKINSTDEKTTVKITIPKEKII